MKTPAISTCCSASPGFDYVALGTHANTAGIVFTPGRLEST
jgi:hypothetical protein